MLEVAAKVCTSGAVPLRPENSVAGLLPFFFFETLESVSFSYLLFDFLRCCCSRIS